MEHANFVFDHPRGPIFGNISDAGLRQLVLPQEGSARPRLFRPPGTELGEILHAALARYFAGIPEDFAEIPLDLRDATPFRRAVWLGARGVSWGETVTYAGLAERIGKTKGAARAVGQALGANPIPIIIPCHRILAAGGRLGGFSAGLAWKRVLLGLEAGSQAAQALV